MTTRSPTASLVPREQLIELARKLYQISKVAVEDWAATVQRAKMLPTASNLEAMEAARRRVNDLRQAENLLIY